MIVAIAPAEIAVDTIQRINVLIVLELFQFTSYYGGPRSIILTNRFTIEFSLIILVSLYNLLREKPPVMPCVTLSFLYVNSNSKYLKVAHA
jgi:hypothetical protein